MILILSMFLSFIFFILGIIHMNWVFGGAWGFDKAIPTKKNGEKVLNPKKIDSAVVGLGLIVFGLFYLLKTPLIDFDLPNWIVTYGSWIIPGILILRAVGEFKYVGFFKAIKETEFGKLDTKFYSPLCLMLGIFGIVIVLMK